MTLTRALLWCVGVAVVLAAYAALPWRPIGMWP